MMNTTKLMTVAALLASVSFAAVAEEKKNVCADNQAANVELVKQLNATKNADERKALLSAALKRDAGNAVCLTDLLKGSDLYDSAVEILASTDGDIEPAAGGNGGNKPTDLGNTTGNPNNGGNVENSGSVSPNKPK